MYPKLPTCSFLSFNPKRRDSPTLGEPGLLEGGDGDSIGPGARHSVGCMQLEPG